MIAESTRATTVFILLKEIFADFDWNCRGVIKGSEVVSLAKEMERDGLLQPIIVRPYNNPQKPHLKWQAVAGFRRLTAARALKWVEIECKVKTDLDEISARLINLKENVDRQDLNIKQEANGLKPFKNAGWTLEMTANQLNQSKGWVQVRYALLELEPEFQELAAAGILKQEHIKHLYSLPRGEQRFQAVRDIKDAKVRGEKFETRRKKKRVTPLVKKNRNSSEIFPWIENIIEHLGPSLATRCMAWCAGEISDLDLLRDIKEACDTKGVRYNPPEGYRSLHL